MNRVSEEPTVTMICEKSYRVSPSKRLHLDISALASQLAEKYDVSDRKSSLIVRLESDVMLTLMLTGSGLVQGVANEEEALSLYQSILQEIEEVTGR